LPHLKFLRNSARHFPLPTPAPAHNAVRIAPGAALPCDALYALLRLAARRFGLEVGKVHEIHDPPEGLP
jgi:hypothetical protein